MSRYLLALGVLAGCATPQPALDASADPALAPAPARTISLAALTPAPQPDLPAPLRAASPSHSAMDHSAMDHSASVAGSPLAQASEALRSAEDALTAGDLARATASAQAFSDAWALATEQPPGSAPHFWHMRMDETRAVRAHALALGRAASLTDARASFEQLRAPFLALVDAYERAGGEENHAAMDHASHSR